MTMMKIIPETKISNQNYKTSSIKTKMFDAFIFVVADDDYGDDDKEMELTTLTCSKCVITVITYTELIFLNRIIQKKYF